MGNVQVIFGVCKEWWNEFDVSIWGLLSIFPSSSCSLRLEFKACAPGMFSSIESIVLPGLNRFAFFRDRGNVKCPLGRTVHSDRMCECWGNRRRKGRRETEGQSTYKTPPWRRTQRQRLVPGGSCELAESAPRGQAVECGREAKPSSAMLSKDTYVRMDWMQWGKDAWWQEIGKAG